MALWELLPVVAMERDGTIDRALPVVSLSESQARPPGGRGWSVWCAPRLGREDVDDADARQAATLDRRLGGTCQVRTADEPSAPGPVASARTAVRRRRM